MTDPAPKSVTTTADLFKIQNIGPAAVACAFTATPLLASPGLVVRVPGTAGAGKDSITFPYWDTDVSAITQTAVRDSREGVAPSIVELKSATEQTITKTISVDIDSLAMRDAALNVNQHLATIGGKELGRECQALLLAKGAAAATAAGLDVDVTSETGAAANLSVNWILEALLAWGDHASELGAPVLFCSSQQFADLGMSQAYRELAQAGLAAPGEGSTSFVRATVHGIPIVLCDAIDKTDGKHNAMLVAPGAMGLFIADDPEVVEIRHAGSTVVTLDQHFRIAAHAFNHHPVRVVNLLTKVGQTDPEPDPEPAP